MGVFEEAKGKAKQAVGDVAGDADLHREGEAQTAKGAAEREAAEARAEAEAFEAKADAHEVEQEVVQETK